MAKIIGRLIDVGIAKESSRGAGASATFWVPKATVSIDDKVAKARSVVSYGNIGLDGNQALVARKHAEGSMEFDLMSDNFGIFLLGLLGTVSTAGPTDSAYTHTFSLQNDNQHDSLAFSINQTSIADLMYRLVMINSLTLKVVPDDVVKVTAEFMSKQSVGSTNTVSYSAESKFLGRHLSLKIATLTSGLAAASNIPVRSLEIAFEKNLRLDHNTGTVEPEDILNQGFRITGTVELDYEDRTYRDLMSDGSYRAVRIDLTNTEATIGAGAVNPKFLLDLSRVDFEAWEPAYPNDEVATQTFNFMALHDLTNNNIIDDCQLVNGTSSY